MAANVGANNHHLIGRGEATLEIEDDRFGHGPLELGWGISRSTIANAPAGRASCAKHIFGMNRL
jgi:hypothetical protein